MIKDKSKEEIQQLIKDAWLNIYVKESTIYNPTMHIPEVYEEKPELYFTYLMTRPEYFSFICKEFLGIQLLPVQALMLQELWVRKFPMLIATRGGGKSWLMAVYAVLRALLLPNRKIVIAGSVFRQSKVIFEYIESIWNNSPILRSMCTAESRPRYMQDMWRFEINSSKITALPIGTGEKIRGQRANDILADEFAAQSEEVFENVISGFAVVSSNVVEGVQRYSAAKMSQALGELTDDYEEEAKDSNQIILSGTAYYDFNHFARYWKDWKEIINSRGDKKRLEQYFERKSQDGDDKEIPEGFNWKDYSIIRIPIELFPKGFMDESNIARSKATIHSSNYMMEFGACFSKDSAGFFKRSLIESCIAKPANNISFPSESNIVFHANTSGDPGKKYVYGIDPASEVDNFSIVVLEVWPDHRRIVYVWTSNKKEFKELLKKGLVQENDYFTYCARKIRNLMKKFPTERIGIDSQGGGYAISEALHDNERLREGEIPIWPVIDYDKPADSDAESGLHFLKLVQFADYNWLSEANEGMRLDFENKMLLFPFFDAIETNLSIEKDRLQNKIYDTLEDCVLEIEELKDELAQIVMTSTPSGTRYKWDTPETKLPGGKKGRLKKDRYSALLIANACAKELIPQHDIVLPTPYGGFATTTDRNSTQGQMFNGPEWYNKKMEGVY